MSETSFPKEKARWITYVFFFLSGIVTATWSSRIPDIQRKLSLNDAQWGLVLFSLPVGLVIALPLSSWVVARYGTTRVMILTMLLYACSLVFIGMSVTTWHLILVLFLFGMFRNATNISINTQAVEVQKQYNKPIISSFHGVWSLACFVAAGFGTWMIAKKVFPIWHFTTAALFCIIITVFYKNKSPKSGTATERRPFFIMPNRYLFLLGVIAFCSMICEGTMFDWGVNYFKRVVGIKDEWITVGYTSFIIAMACGRLFGDRMIASFGPINMLILNGCIMSIGFLLAIIFPFLLPASFGFLLVGLGDSILVPLVYMLAANEKFMPPAYAISSVTIIGYVGFLVGPPIVGTISEALGMQWAFVLMSVLSLLIVVIALLVKNHSAHTQSVQVSSAPH